MLIFNLPQSVKPTRVAKGVDPRSMQIMPPAPMFQPTPFKNYFALRSDKSVMGYNQFGNFTATSMAAESTQRAMRDMANNMSIVELTNGKRKGLF